MEQRTRALCRYIGPSRYPKVKPPTYLNQTLPGRDQIELLRLLTGSATDAAATVADCCIKHSKKKPVILGMLGGDKATVQSMRRLGMPANPLLCILLHHVFDDLRTVTLAVP